MTISLTVLDSTLSSFCDISSGLRPSAHKLVLHCIITTFLVGIECRLVHLSLIHQVLLA